MSDHVPLREWLAELLPPEHAEAANELDGMLSPHSSASPLQWHDAFGCYLKREDLGPFGTHKSRGVGLQIALARRAGARGCVISSSGNAAVAAGAWLRALGLPGLAFVSDKTAAPKIEAVVKTGVATAVTAKPKNFSRYAARFAGLVDLRPSRDSNGRLGYRTLAPELVAQLSAPPTAVFVFVNSALTLVGVWEGFRDLLERGRVPFVPRLHAVQCSRSSALADALGVQPDVEPLPAAGGLGAQEPADLEATAAAITRTGGRLWMVRNTAIDEERERLASQGLVMAAESVAMMAGLRKARRGLPADVFGERLVAVVAGPARQRSEETDAALQAVHRPETYADVRALLESLGLGKTDVD